MEKKFTQLIYHGFITCLFFLATTLQAQVTQVFTYTGNTQTFTVPTGVTSLQIKAWGAGGGGSNAINDGGSGGSGAFITTSLTVSPGQVYTIQVGGGGRSGAGIKTGGYAGGGTGGRQSGSGGGYSAVFLGNTIGTGTRVVAGGGGGGAYESKSTYGGGADGADAANMSSTITGGKTAINLTAGASGLYNNDPRGATSGTPYQGGKGSTTYAIWIADFDYDNGGGGGGGGVRGGGGGVGSNGLFSYDSTGGGGGSSYSFSTGAVITPGNVGNSGGWVAAPGNTDSGYIAGVGRGGANRNNGGNGLIIITYNEGLCTGTPSGGTAVLTPNTGSVGSLFTANVTGGTVGALGLTYEWEMSVGSAAGPYTVIPGATAASVQLTAPNEPPGTKIYYRRKITCTNSGISRYSTAAEYTIYSPSYCDPESFINNDYYIKGVKFLGTLNDVQNLNNGFSNNPRGYQDWTGLGTYASQEQGGAINLAVENSRESVMAAWVDWNNNGNFEAGEQIYNTAGTSVGSTIIGFSIPAAQAIGYYRLRIRVSATAISNNPTTNCQDFTNGETEDYLFQVLKACDAKVTSFSVSERCGAGTLPITINTVNATSVKIYTAENANNPIASVNVNNNSATYTTASIAETRVYYVAAVNGTCEARHRVKIIAKINPIPKIDFDNTAREFCGDTSGGQTLEFAALGDKETVELVNENFNTSLGAFTATQAGQNIAPWTHRTSNFIPGSPSVIQPAIASGISGDGFVASVTDVGTGTNRANHLTTTASFNTTGFLNLHLDYNIYTFFEGIKPDVEKVNVEVSQDNGVNWVVLKTYSPTSTGNVGLPNKFMEETLDLNAFINVAALKVRFSIYAFAASGQWSGDIGAVDKIRLYGEKPLTAAFSWSVVGGDAILYNDDCTTPYNGATNSICVKPSAALLETKPSWTIEAAASLSNGCSATGSVNIINNNRTWNNTARTNWNQNYWTPSGIPDQDKCVLIKTPIGINNATNALAKNIRIETTAGATGKLTVNGSLTVTDAIVNTGAATDFIVKSDANLLQINENPNLNTTPISVRRKFTWSDDLRKEYNYLASPVKGQNMKALFGATTNTPFALVLRESTNTFVNAAAADYEEPGKGFAVKEPAKSFEGGGDIADHEGEFKGVPNNGIFTTPITKTVASRGWNLIGNPYPSNLDLQQFYQDNSTKILPEFRFWDNRLNNTYVQYGGAYQGYSYAIFNAISGVGNPAPGGDIHGNNEDDMNPLTSNGNLYQYAKVSQGFVVRAANLGSVDLTFKNTQRVVTPAEGFFGRNEMQKDLYRLQLITPDSLTMTQTILYIPNGLNSVGLEDSKHPNSNASDAFYSMEETSKLLINAKAPFQITDKVPLGNNHFIAGVYKIRAVNRLGVFANGQAIYLKDKKLNVMADLTQGDYSYTSEAGIFSDRFEIVYQPETVLATEGTTKASLEVYRDAGDFVIRSSEKAIELMELYDASGRLVLSQKGNGKELRFATATLAEGMYVVKTRLKDGQELTKKIRK